MRLFALYIDRQSASLVTRLRFQPSWLLTTANNYEPLAHESGARFTPRQGKRRQGMCIAVVLPNNAAHTGHFGQFSVDDFEAAGTTAWEGVRNFEARNLMKEMVVGDKVSPCKKSSARGAQFVGAVLPLKLQEPW